MKSVPNILLITVLAALLMQIYCAQMELKTNCEALEWRINNKTEQLDIVVAGLMQRTRPNSQSQPQRETGNPDQANPALNRSALEVIHTNTSIGISGAEYSEN